MPAMPLGFRHLVSVSDLSDADIGTILDTADRMAEVIAQGGNELLKGKILATLFFEPSTRTRLSFESAMLRLGGRVISVPDAGSSSMKKGESIEDAIRMAERYADILCMRHPEPGSAARAAAVSAVPFLNAGDGGNEHPTQALLDLFTVRREKGRLDNLHVAFSCDPLHSRTIRSFATLLSRYPGNRITFISPESLRAAPELLAQLRAAGATVEEKTDLKAGVDADILYMNRLQQERFADPREFEKLRYDYVLTAAMLAGKSVLVMDPLPRIDEIATEVDALPNAVYFRQAGNGVPVRMALLALLLGKA
jgi:aspartate carbamoyltransferase catalytic subunit